MDRKEFFKEAFRKVAGFGLELFEDSKVINGLEDLGRAKEQPPGAVLDFAERCTGCDACMAACPVNVILIEDLEKRLPVIYPEENPCIHCEGYPCIQSCPTGALVLGYK